MVQNEMKHVKELFSAVLLITLLVNGLLLVFVDSGLAQAPGVIVVIGSDTTWTKADSPHELTGPLLVNQGVTLTIEAGATVNLNGYELRVNGTLRAIGVSNDKIHFNNGLITFTEHSNGWNEETGSGSIIQFALLEDVEIVNHVPVSINDIPMADYELWTKEDSPIEFSGTVVIEEGNSLMIEAGVTVNLNGHALVVKGTLCVLGSSSENVYFNGSGTGDAAINFTESSNGWDEQTGSGSIIEYASLWGVIIVSEVPLKIRNIETPGLVSVGGSSVIIGNTIGWFSTTGGTALVSNNTIQTISGCYGSPEISNNTIESIRDFGGSPVISNNTIGGIGYVIHPGSKREIRSFVADSPVITNNIIEDGIYLNGTGHSIISYNNITGYSYTYEYLTGRVLALWYETGTARTSGIILEGNGSISGNRINDCDIGIQGGTTIEGNVLTNNNHGLKVYSDATIRGNIFRFNDESIFVHNNPVLAIKDNLFIDNGEGINAAGTLTIERNSIINSTIAIKLHTQSSQVTIKNNTFVNNDEAIRVLDELSSVTINYNNIENCSQHSINLMGTSRNVIDATNNWWGTTDTQVINLTIHDYKYEFDLGRVNFVPFLTKPNPEAASTIPEFPSWIISPLIIAATVLIIFCRRKLKNDKKVTNEAVHIRRLIEVHC